MALVRTSIHSLISREPSACRSNVRVGEMTLKQKFLSVSTTSAGCVCVCVCLRVRYYIMQHVYFIIEDYCVGLQDLQVSF